MNNEEIIKALTPSKEHCARLYIEALDKAIKALEQEPSEDTVNCQPVLSLNGIDIDSSEVQPTRPKGKQRKRKYHDDWYWMW